MYWSILYEGVLGEYDLHINIMSEDVGDPEIGYLDAIEKKKQSKKWVAVRDILRKSIDRYKKIIDDLEWERFITEKISEAQIENDEMKIKARAIIEQMGRIVYEVNIHVEEIPIQNPLEISEIFDRVNSEGVRVTDADVAFALVAANDYESKWPEQFDDFKEWLEKNDFTLKTPTILKIITLAMQDQMGVDILTTRMDRVISKIKQAKISDSWPLIKNSIENSVLFLKSLGVPDSSMIIHDNLFVILTYFWRRFLINKSVDENMKKKLAYWFLKAIYSGVYASSDNNTSEMINKLKEQNNPNDGLIALLDTLNEVDFKLDDGYFAQKHAPRSLAWLILYLLIQDERARDWFSDEPLFYDPQVSRARKLERHHIFPKDCVKNALNENKLNLDKEIAEVYKHCPANFALIYGLINVKIGSDEPVKYISEKISGERLGEVAKQLIPHNDDTLLRVKNFENFINWRDKKLKEWFEGYLNRLYSAF